MFYRYELYLDGEYQGCGIFCGLDDIGLPADEVTRLLKPFDDGLSLPDIPEFDMCGIFPAPYYTFLFTERGREKFAEPLHAILQAYETNGPFEVRELVVDPSEFKDQDMPYNDGLQVAICENVFNKYREKKGS